MAKKDAVQPLPTEEVEHAINRVLTEERDARLAVEECRRQAQAMLEAARTRSRYILERTDDSIARARAIADASVERRLADLRAEAERFSQAPLVDEDRTARLRQWVPVLARELVGSRE